MRWASPRAPEHRLAAAALAERALKDHPDRPALRLARARALAGADKLDEAAACLRSALIDLPEDEPLYEEMAKVLARRGEIEAALACARDRSAEWAPVFAFKLLVRHGRRAEADALESAVAGIRPTDPDLLGHRIRRARGDPAQMLQLCEAVLDRDPGAAHALHYKAVALALLGRGGEAEALMGLDRFLHNESLPSPPGFEDDPGFRRRLRSEILANPGLHPDPAGHATRAGLRTRTFPAAGDRAGPALIGAIRSAVQAYAEALSGDHAFVRARPARATLTPWALIFRGGGHQVPHHHPGSWLTGVYYVHAHREDAPAESPKAPRPGIIRLGVFPDGIDAEPPWPVIEIEPVPGTLLLFPAFVPHETVPPGDGAERISIAFDVTAESEEGSDQ